MPFPKFFKNKKTVNTFGAAPESKPGDVQQRLPAASTQEPVPVTPPSHDFVMKQRGEVDDKVEDQEGGDSSAQKGAVKMTPTPLKRTDNTVVNKQGTASATISGSLSFTPFWDRSTDYDLHPTVFSEMNEFTPNALAMFKILRTTANLASTHRDLLKRHPEYNGYAVACYYSVIFYIQILRARRSAGRLTGNDSTLLRRFEREHPFEGLPICQPLEAYFNTIVSTTIEDSRYGWIIPRIETANFRATMATAPDDTGLWLLQPQVPYMLSILRMMIDKPMWSRQTISRTFTANAQDYCFLDEEDRFVPHTIHHAGHQNPTVWGLQINGAARTTRTDFVLTSSGLNYPVTDSTDSILLSAKKWWSKDFRSDINVLPLDYLNVGQGAQPTPADGLTRDGSTPITNLEQFLFMRKDMNINWFNDLAENATIHARIFGTATNLGRIPTTGGESTTIITEFNRPSSAAARTFASVANAHVGEMEWYRDLFSGLTASFHTSISGMAREEMLQALTFGVNANLHIEDTNGHTIGSLATQRTGRFFVNGPELKEELFCDDDGRPIRPGKPMFSEFGQVVQTHFYKERFD